MRWVAPLILLAATALADTNVTISPMYDNRQSAYIHTIDDYAGYNSSDFITAIDKAWALGIPTEVGAYATNTLLTAGAISALQPYLDAGAAVVASHSLNEYNFGACTSNDLAFYERTVRDSKTLLEAAFDLGDVFTYAGSDYLVNWIQSYATVSPSSFQPIITHMAATNLYLLDAAGMQAGTTNGKFAVGSWNETTNLYDRIYRHAMTIYPNSFTNYLDLNQTYFANRIDSCLTTTGEVYCTYSHPASPTYGDYDNDDGQYVTMLNYAAGHSELWYTTLSWLYSYRYLRDRATPTITCTESSAYTDIEVTCDGAEREKYGLGFPLTYEYALPASMTNSSVVHAYVKHDGQTAFLAIPNKTGKTGFSSGNAFRRDGNTLYISQAFSTTTTNFTLRVQTARPIPVGGIR